MKNTIITILAILVLVLGGDLVYDKFIAKEDPSNKGENIEQNVGKKYVANAFSESLTTDWPIEELGKDNTDPDTVTKKVEIPKILIETNSTKIINDKIYNDYMDFIKMFDKNYQFETFEKTQIINITYDYKIQEDIIYIIIKNTSSSSRAGGEVSYMAYYYDIKNDKVLTVDDICKKYNIDLKFSYSYDESADKIYAVMPTYLGKFDVYYTQKGTCTSINCKDMYSTF